MTPAFPCPKTAPPPAPGPRLQLDFALDEVQQLYTAGCAYYGDPAAPPLNRDDSAATTNLHRALCTLYIALRSNTKSAL